MVHARNCSVFFAFLFVLLLGFEEISCKKKPVPVRAGCEFEGMEYKDGETFLSECSPCTCSDGEYSCSYVACDNQNCHYKHTTYSSGERFMDGCMSCLCAKSKVECDSDDGC